MAWLNRILWLKCRLTERAYSHKQGNIATTAVMVIFAFLASSLFALYVGGELMIRPVQEAREMLHIVLLAIYFFWITFPLFGYRINESLDVTRLFLYPLGSFRIFFGSFLGHLLELSTLLVLPVFVACAFAMSPELQDLIPASLVLVIFLLQTVATSQLLLSLLLNSLKDRKVSDRMMIIVPLVMAMSIWAFEFGLFVTGAGNALLKMEISHYSVWLPAGLAADTLVSLSRGDQRAFAYQLGTLLALTLLTIVLASRANEWLMTRGGGGPKGREDWVENGVPRSLLFEFSERFLGQQKILAVAVKELKLIFREPQCRLLLVLFGLTYAITLGSGLFFVPESGRGFLLATLGMTVELFFVGLIFNSFAMERTGLRFLIIAPVHPVAILVGKNLAYWAFISCLMLVSMGTMAVTLDVPSQEFLAQLLSWQGFLVILLAVGNVVSVLAPYRLPSTGLVHQHRVSFGQVLWISLMGMIGMGVTGLASIGSLVFILPPALSGDWKSLAELPVLLVLYVAGVYTALTLLSAMLLDLRGEKILEQILD